MSELIALLDRVTFLRTEDEATRRSFADMATCRTYPKHNILFHHEDPCFAAYVVLSGRVKLSLSDEDGRELTLDVFGPGEVCGLVAAIDGKPHTGTAMTMETTRVAIVPRERFQRWLADRPLLQGRVLLEVAHLLRQAYNRVGSQVLLSVKHRLREVLLDMAHAEDAQTQAGEMVVPRPTHQELAERVGSTRVVVSRAIKALLEEEAGIRMEGRTLRVRLHAVETDLPVRK